MQVCQDCGAEFAPYQIELEGPIWKPETCPSCRHRFETEREQRQQRAEEEEEEREREKRWSRFCAAVPPTYRKNDPARLPAGYAVWQAAADVYEFGPQGLAFIGPNRAGKTRAMSALLFRLCFQEGRRVRAVPGVGLAEDIIALSGFKVPSFVDPTSLANAPTTIQGYLRSLIGAEVLFVDDLDKGRWLAWKEAPAAALYQLLDGRINYGLPFFFTANTGGAGLLGMLGERGPAIVGRLKDLCQVVTLPEGEVST